MSHFSFSSLFALGLILVVGYFAGRLAAFFRIPQISGYIVAGLLFSPSINGIFPAEHYPDVKTFKDRKYAQPIKAAPPSSRYLPGRLSLLSGGLQAALHLILDLTGKKAR